jgi:DNA-binding response OmpR family regulator
VLIVAVGADQELGAALGADDYFLKPLDRHRFLERLRELVPPEAAGRAQVLVVDDDPLVHEYLGLELEEAGFEVRSAYDAADAVRAATESPPAVVVLDLILGEVDGFRVALELQARPETAQVPIVAFTAKELDAGERRRLSERIAAVLSKAPDDRRRLPAVLRGLESRRHRRGRDATRLGGRG